MHSRSVAAFYKPELDGLRFFAFLCVFVSHALSNFSSSSPALVKLVHVVAQAGDFGVDLFFALSSYLITELLLREIRQTGSLDIRAFYVRRSLRIWPLYFFFVGICFFATRLDHTQVIGRSVALGYFLFAANWVIVAQGRWPASFISPLWSVSVEEQFYLAWPWLVRKASRRHIFGVALAMLAVATGTRIYFAATGASDPAVWACTLSRLDPIACGAMVAVFMNGGEPRRSPARSVLFIAIGLTIVLLGAAAWDRVTAGSITPIFCYLIAAAGVTMILFGSFGFDVLKWKPFVELGKRSYGLYVYHSLGFYLAMHLMAARSTIAALVAFRLLALTLTIGMAWLSYALLEAPFLKLKRRFTIVPSRDNPAASPEIALQLPIGEKPSVIFERKRTENESSVRSSDPVSGNRVD